MEDICPCPNPTCPNHGDCAKCTSSHLRKGYLSYCAFHTILPALKKVIADDPASPAARTLESLITPQLEAYGKLMDQNGLSQEELDQRLASVAAFSPT